ncbi:hypothetical protein [Nocardioides sp. 616]|uniref:hypothetical protein n=1 Tax=Nocardioides sp. 616 TaxID=2268090 RepID=UPI0013B44B3F|nr:hypothetical protein [Nocardioides sp. 616]
MTSARRGTAMSTAARYRSVEDFLACYRPSAAARWVDPRGETLLHHALCNSERATRLRIAELLLSDGADAAALSAGGYSTAHLLVARVRPEHAGDEAPLLAALFDRGCDVNHAHPREGVALEALAARFQFSDQDLAPYYAVFLARPDLDLLTPTTYGRSTLETIRRWRIKRAHLVELLEERLHIHGPGLPAETVFSLAKWASTDRILSAYQPGDLLTRDPATGWPLLHTVLDNPDVDARIDVAARLLEDGADPATTTPEGLTPPHILLREHGTRDHAREAALLQRLFDAGADPNAVAEKVGTPLNCLARMTNLDEESRLPLYDVLLAHPQFDPRTRVGRTKTAWDALGQNRTAVLRARLVERFP